MHNAKTAGLQKLLQDDLIYAARYSELVQRVENYYASVLSRIYRHEYSSWKNRKSWSKEHGRPWAQELFHFRDFLIAAGPIPEPGWTLDRIDCKGEYHLSNLRWASKSEQSQNRSIARKILIGDVPYTITQLSLLTGKSYDATRVSLDRHGDGFARQLLTASAEETWQFPEEQRSELEIEYGKRRGLHQNRLQFFLAFTRTELDRYEFMEGMCWRAERKLELSENIALIRSLRKEAVTFLERLNRRRELERRDHSRTRQLSPELLAILAENDDPIRDEDF